MKWKTVSVIFFLVVLYLVMGALVFRALEQPHERCVCVTVWCLHHTRVSVLFLSFPARPLCMCDYNMRIIKLKEE